MIEQENLFDLCDFVQEDLKFMIKSGIRMKILISLYNGPRTMKEIKEKQNLSFATVSNNMKLLLNEDLVIKEDDKYRLSQLGYLKLDNIIDFHQAMQVSNSFEDLWIGHNLEGIPNNFINEIGALFDSHLIKSSSVDIYKPHNNYKEIIGESQCVYGISPISHPEFIELYEELIQTDIKIELILTDEIIKKTIATADFKNLCRAVTNKNLNLRRYTGNNLTIAFTVTDTFISLGLFNDDGIFDQNRDLISRDKEAIDWGMRLYNYYRESSEKINLKNFAKIFVS